MCYAYVCIFKFFANLASLNTYFLLLVMGNVLKKNPCKMSFDCAIQVCCCVWLRCQVWFDFYLVRLAKSGTHCSHLGSIRHDPKFLPRPERPDAASSKKRHGQAPTPSSQQSSFWTTEGFNDIWIFVFFPFSFHIKERIWDTDFRPQRGGHLF